MHRPASTTYGFYKSVPISEKHATLAFQTSILDELVESQEFSPLSPGDGKMSTMVFRSAKLFQFLIG
jgi:hypothetical protein